MCSKIYNLKELFDIKDYTKWAKEEIHRNFAKKLAGKQVAGL